MSTTSVYHSNRATVLMLLWSGPTQMRLRRRPLLSEPSVFDNATIDKLFIGNCLDRRGRGPCCLAESSQAPHASVGQVMPIEQGAVEIDSFIAPGDDKESRALRLGSPRTRSSEYLRPTTSRPSQPTIAPERELADSPSEFIVRGTVDRNDGKFVVSADVIHRIEGIVLWSTTQQRDEQQSSALPIDVLDVGGRYVQLRAEGPPTRAPRRACGVLFQDGFAICEVVQ